MNALKEHYVRILVQRCKIEEHSKLNYNYQKIVNNSYCLCD